jgi:valyl-tRNA synthetase
MNLDDYIMPCGPTPATVADRWILSRLATLAATVEDGIKTYEFGETARALYDFFWNDFCDWYIELSKSRLQVGPLEDAGDELRASRYATQSNLVFVLDTALRLLHPMMPFVTEEIWRNVPLGPDYTADSLMVAAWPDPSKLAKYADEGAERSIELLQDVVVSVRAVRARYQIPPKQALDVVVRAPQAEAMLLRGEASLVRALAGVGSFEVSADATKPEHAAASVAGPCEIYAVLEGLVDFEAERVRLGHEREKVAVEHERLEKKLSNEGFLAKAAAEVIEKDRGKAADLADTLATLDAQLAERG